MDKYLEGLLNGAGIQTRYNGKFRTTMEILNDFANVWDRLTESQRVAISQYAFDTFAKFE